MKRNRKHFLQRLGALCLCAAVIVCTILGSSLSAGAASDRNQAGSAPFAVTYIDVGQGDSELISCGGHYMLIDGGGRSQSDTIYTILKNRGITHLDYLVCTHPDEDHVGGLSGALYAATADTVYAPTTEGASETWSDFRKTLRKKGNEITIPKAGDTFPLGESTFTVVGPVAAADDSNNLSLVLRAVYGDNTFLFTGDAEAPEESSILAAGEDISAQVLKVGHHGSDTSSTAPFLKAVSPRIAVISCGRHNSYGHPDQSVLDRLKSCGATICRTDLQGDITVTSDGTNLSVQTQKNADADTSAAANAAVSPESSAQNSARGSASKKPAAAVSGTAPTGSSSAQAGRQTSTTQPRYILNTRSKKIHLPGCSAVARMAEHNKKETNESIAQIEAEDPGYTPCSICHPERTE